ncbi:hypothetical protein GOODEAATRI_016766 [Goodea atripinnis]|uniref:Sleeping Beauty transposase HTH domain-containing protein n=1 Tax=Goodea atripinnis TaxID=208336 RepID=A0ABV0N218_9TELE
MSKIIRTLCKVSQSMRKYKCSIPFQIVQAVLKHHNYPDLINLPGEKQQLFAVGLWTFVAKIKKLTKDLQPCIVAAHNSGKGYKTTSKCFLVPVATVQGINNKYKMFRTV